MERRLLTFVVASTAFFICYAYLRVMFAPPIPDNLPGDGDPAAEVALDQGEPLAVVDQPGDPLGDDAEPDSRAQPDDDAADLRPKRSQWLTAGSMDPESGHVMIAYFTSRGGAIERIELTEREESGALRYRRVDVFNGYLGYLAAETNPEADGVIVNVVGPGTPADAAGIKVGDTIVALAGKAVASREQFNEALLATKPGQQVTLEVIRKGSPIPLSATLSEHPLDVVRLARDGGADQIAGNLSRPSCLFTLGNVNRKSILTNEKSISRLIDPAQLNWFFTQQNDSRADTVEFSVELSEAEMTEIGGKPLRLLRTYSVEPGSYAIQMSIQIDNLSAESQRLAYRLEGANGLTLEGWWYSTKISPNFSGAAARDIVYKTAADGHGFISGYNLLKRAKQETNDPNQSIFAPDGDDASRSLMYMGVDAQYFFVGYVPARGETDFSTLRRASAGIVADTDEVPRHQERAVNVTHYLDSNIREVPAGASMRQNLQLFAGPKRPELLAEFGLGDCIYYGWFSAFAKLLGGLLHQLSVVGNYALAIILLTVVVRALMFPLSRKAAVNAQKMQELAPELKKIKEKHKDDMEAQLKAQRELQQRVGFNPLAGCLPMFLQLPIFIGLYRTLSVDIELRQAAFSKSTDWASNLAAPDMLAYWGDWLWEYLSGRGTGWLGPYFNILPVFVVVLFLLQQKMFMPPATDDQTAMTQKMMNIMTLMMGLFFFRVPAGLCIYFITSSLWGICERILVKKTLPTDKHFDLQAEGPSGGGTSQGLVDRIRSQVAKPEESFDRPNKRKRPKKKK